MLHYIDTVDITLLYLKIQVLPPSLPRYCPSGKAAAALISPAAALGFPAAYSQDDEWECAYKFVILKERVVCATEVPMQFRSAAPVPPAAKWRKNSAHGASRGTDKIKPTKPQSGER
jgi:hypothetical protein